MDPLSLIAGGSQLLGGLLSAGSQKKAAKKALNEARRQQQYLIAAAREDAYTAQVKRDADMAQLAKMRGVDLVKLREDAVAAGFNPLTVLQATGAAQYDRADGFISSPFMPVSDAYRTGADYVMQARGLGVQTAGGVGAAIANAGSAFVNTKMSVAEMRMQQQMLKAMLSDGGTKGNAAVPNAPPVKGEWQAPAVVDKGPSPETGRTGPFGDIPATEPKIAPNGNYAIQLPAGGWMYVTPAIAAQYGLKPGDRATEALMENEYVQLRETVASGYQDLSTFWSREWQKEVDYWKGVARPVTVPPSAFVNSNVRHPGNSIDPALWGTRR